MKYKHTYTAIIAILFIGAMYFYHEQMTLTEIISAFVGSSGAAIGLYSKLTQKEVKNENTQIKKDFEKLSGMSVKQYREQF